VVVLPEKLKKFHRLQAPVWPSSAFKAPIMVQRTFFLWQNPLIVQICSDDSDTPHPRRCARARGA